MTYTQEITLDLNASSAISVVYAKQSDTESRQLLVHFTKDGAEYEVDHNNSVALRIRKPDGHQIMNYASINYDGTVTVTFTQQCLAVPGRAYADLVEFSSSGQVLSTAAFIINIIASPDVMGAEAASSDEFNYLLDFINRGNQIIGEAQEWANGYNGDVPVTDPANPAYQNNAKYWSERAGQIVDGLYVAAGEPVAPGAEPTSVKSVDPSTGVTTYTLGLPAVKPYATLSVTDAEEGAPASGSVVVTSVPSMAGPGEVPELQKSFDFSLAIPRGLPGGFSDQAAIEVKTLKAGSAATAEVQVLKNSPNTAKQFKFIFGIPQGAVGATGLPGRDGAAGAAGSQGLTGATGVGITDISASDSNTLIFSLTNGQTSTVTGYTLATPADFVFSNNGGDLVIAAAASSSS